MLIGNSERENKYRKCAREFAKVICDIMNLLYKEKEARDFKHELLLEIQEIKFKNNRWKIEKKGKRKIHEESIE